VKISIQVTAIKEAVCYLYSIYDQRWIADCFYYVLFFTTVYALHFTCRTFF